LSQLSFQLSQLCSFCSAASNTANDDVTN